MQARELRPNLQVIEPANIDAECEVLGAILLDPGAIGRVAHKMPSDEFYIYTNRLLY